MKISVGSSSLSKNKLLFTNAYITNIEFSINHIIDKGAYITNLSEKFLKSFLNKDKKILLERYTNRYNKIKGIKIKRYSEMPAPGAWKKIKKFVIKIAILIKRMLMKSNVFFLFIIIPLKLVYNYFYYLMYNNPNYLDY